MLIMFLLGLYTFSVWLHMEENLATISF